MSGDGPLRVLFVNSGILGHASVARLIADAAARMPGIAAEHVDLSGPLTTRERVIRKALCARPLAALGLRTNVDLARWRQEMHAGLLARRRIRAREAAACRPFDVLHFHTQATAYASLGRMRATPSLVSIDATQRLASLEAPAGIERATFAANVRHDRAVFAAARAIVATSAWAADDLAAGQPEVADRVSVLPYPVPLDRFDAPAWIAERHARTGPVRVLFVGGDWPRKGGPALLRAWSDGGFASDAALTVATDWPIGEAIPAGVSVRRGVRAYSPEWTEMWRQADVFCMPTTGEAFGMVFQEAAAAGVPAIGTRLAAVPEIVEDGRTGLLVPPGDGGALVDALRRLVASAQLRREMGTAARARAERLFSPDGYAARLGSLIRRAAGRTVGDA
jgi:starch synthase